MSFCSHSTVPDCGLSAAEPLSADDEEDEEEGKLEASDDGDAEVQDGVRPGEHKFPTGLLNLQA